jgi:hypothetical protein
MSARMMATAAALTALFAAPASAHKRPAKPTLADLATVWVGGEPGYSLEYFRLELDTRGKGLLVVQWIPDKPAVAYTVIETKLSEYRVEFILRAVDRPAESLYLRGEALRSFLDLEAGSLSPKWKRRVTMEPYARLMERIKAVTDRAGSSVEADH